jgi:hypothetical protein
MSDTYDSLGILGSYRWWFGYNTPLKGWYAGPVFVAGVKTLAGGGDDVAIGTRSGYFGAGAAAGYQWIFKNGFAVDAGNATKAWAGYAKINYGLTLSLGYSF